MTHDFEALRRERNEAAKTEIERLARDLGWTDGEGPLFSTFDPDACYCACANGGPCEHDWSGQIEEFDGGWTVTCKRCGGSAMSHDMRNAP